MRAASFLTGVLLLLAGGIWLGGHPETLPAPVRDALVDTGPATRAEIIDVIQERGGRVIGTTDAGLPGPKGNREVFVHCADAGTPE